MKKNIPPLKLPQGITLIEITVVIALLVVLISVLFIGAKYYRNSANRSACVLNLSAIEKAAMAMENISGSRPANFAATYAAGAPLNGNTPSCPVGGTESYTVSAAVAKCSVTTPLSHSLIF